MLLVQGDLRRPVVQVTEELKLVKDGTKTNRTGQGLETRQSTVYNVDL